MADVDPLDVDGIRTVWVGSGLWVVAFVVLLFFRDTLADQGRTWWLGTCVAGFVLGVVGGEYCRRRARRLREGRPSPILDQ